MALQPEDTHLPVTTTPATVGGVGVTPGAGAAWLATALQIAVAIASAVDKPGVPEAMI